MSISVQQKKKKNNNSQQTLYVNKPSSYWEWNPGLGLHQFTCEYSDHWATIISNFHVHTIYFTWLSSTAMMQSHILNKPYYMYVHTYHQNIYWKHPSLGEK